MAMTTKYCKYPLRISHFQQPSVLYKITWTYPKHHHICLSWAGGGCILWYLVGILFVWSYLTMYDPDFLQKCLVLRCNVHGYAWQWLQNTANTQCVSAIFNSHLFSIKSPGPTHNITIFASAGLVVVAYCDVWLVFHCLFDHISQF